MNPESIFEAISAEPGIGIGCCTPDGHILATNENGSLMFFGRPAEEVVGKNLRDLLPPEVAEERISIFSSMKDPKQAIVLRYTWRAQRFRSVYRLIPGSESEGEHILIVSRPVGKSEIGNEVPGAEERESSLIELGELDTLSPREIEVLALLGQGMRIREIAELFNRSPKTIERHREAIGQKLGSADRADLILVAQQAGLRVEDAKLKRVQLGAGSADIPSGG